MSKKFNFIKEAVKNYKTSGTLIPSSRFLADKMLKTINFSSAKVIVELGPGDGAITRHILKRLNPNAILVCFEINDAFYNELLKIKHPQLKVLKASAENIDKELNKLGINKVDAIVSSLPLAIIPKKITDKVLLNSYNILKKNGLFMQYQYSLTYYKKLQIFYSKSITLKFELLNLPPAFVYKCVKK